MAMLRVSEIICLKVRRFFLQSWTSLRGGSVWQERAVAEPGLPLARPESEK